MPGTKNGKFQKLPLPPKLIDTLRWHQSTQLHTAEQRASELLFPSESGGLRSQSFLKKAFKKVSELMGLKHPITPRAMRRSFVDTARMLGYSNLVARVVTGHSSDAMFDHYATVLSRDTWDVVRAVYQANHEGDTVLGSPVEPPMLMLGTAAE